MLKKIVILIIVAVTFTACGASKCGVAQKSKKYYNGYAKKVKRTNKR